MTAPEPGAEQAGRRAAKNSVASAASEIVGKLSTLALLAVLAREVGQEDLGVFFFAFAYLGIVLIPVGFGTDWYMLRETAAERRASEGPPSREVLDHLFWNVLALKLAVSGPILLLGGLAMVLLGYPAETQLVVGVMAVGLLLDQFARSFVAVFSAYERSDLLAISLVAQRLLTAALGIGVLLAGRGLLTVAAVFAVGSVVRVGLETFFLRRHLGLPRVLVAPGRWREITRASLPFAVQDIFTVILFKLDAVLLSVLAADAAVGRYGVAYRLLESTMFVAYALNGAFVAMYVYLTHESAPTVGTVFGQSIKLALVVLIPVALVLGILAEPVCTLLFGAGLADAAPAMRLLSPVVVLLAVVILSTSLVVSRKGAGAMLKLSALMVTLNVVLNLVLIPGYAEQGSAVAMLITESVFALVTVIYAARLVGGLAWEVVLAGPAVAGAAMAALLVAFGELPLLAAVAGVAGYVLVLLAWERVRSPADLAFVISLVRRRLIT